MLNKTLLLLLTFFSSTLIFASEANLKIPTLNDDQQSILVAGIFICILGLIFGVYQFSPELAEEPLVIPEDSISSVLLRLEPGIDPMAISEEIMRQVPGVTPITSPNMFQAYRQQMNGLLATSFWYWESPWSFPAC